MKYTLAYIIVFWGLNAYASCPNLTGQFTEYTWQNGQVDITIDQVVEEGITIYSYQKNDKLFELITDGRLRTINSENTKIYERYFCKKEILYMEKLEEVYNDQGRLLCKTQFYKELSLMVDGNIKAVSDGKIYGPNACKLPGGATWYLYRKN